MQPTSQELAEWIRSHTGHPHPFYRSGWWERRRAEVLRLDRYECQMHRQRGQYARATMVHHVNTVEARPDLALSIWTGEPNKSERNLISLCHSCHEEIHGHRHEVVEPLTPERW